MDNLIKKTPEELREMLAEKREALRAFRFGASGSKARNVREGRSLRHDIARILTQLEVTQKTV